jgi:hypothetical protein
MRASSGVRAALRPLHAAAGGDQVHPVPGTAAALGQDVLALQVTFGKAQAAVRAGHAVAPEQLARRHGGRAVEQVDPRGTAQRDDGMDLDQRLPAAGDVPAATQRTQRTAAVEPRHGTRGMVRGGLFDRDPGLGRALDVELQHVAMRGLHARPSFRGRSIAPVVRAFAAVESSRTSCSSS